MAHASPFPGLEQERVLCTSQVSTAFPCRATCLAECISFGCEACPVFMIHAAACQVDKNDTGALQQLSCMAKGIVQQKKAAQFLILLLFKL